MNTQSRAPFWLEVKKEYIIENFESLVKYLKEYSVKPDDISVMEDSASDFGRTYSSLKELAYEYMAEFADDSIYTYEETPWEDISPKIRRMFTYLLSAKIKGITDHKVLAKICDLLLLTGSATTRSSIIGLKNVIIGCLKESKFTSYGISWQNIQEWNNYNPEFICTCLGNATYETDSNNCYCNEGLGCLAFEDGVFHVAPMNKSDYSGETPKSSLITSNSGVNFNVEKAEFTVKGRNFEELKETCSDMLGMQNSIKPSPVIIKKEYKVGDELVVRVTGQYEYGVYAESVDSNYKKIVGKVFIGNNDIYYVNYKDFKNHLKKGDYILVRIQTNVGFPFTIVPCFYNFYEHYANTCYTQTCGIYYGDYSAGYQWLTLNGLIVNVLKKYCTHEIERAKEDDTPVGIHIGNAIKDKSKNLVVNATYLNDSDVQDMDSGSFEEQAVTNLIAAFVKYAEDQAPVSITRVQKPYKAFDKMYIDLMSHIEYFYANKILNTQDRYAHLFIARFLAGINGTIKDMNYISMEMDYQNCLVQFASGLEPKFIEFKPKEDLLSIRSVQWRLDIMSKLKEYETEGREMTDIEFKSLSVDEKKDAIKGLVDSSNLINGKITQAELNRIKKQVTTLLNVSDEFVSPKMDLTYYGEESDTLEFKSSAVFPPDNEGQAEPTRQLWTILKTICGFLNTLSGGELILGVKDNGNSCGLKDDIEYLYNNGKIAEASMDKYRNYIKLNADKAFLDDIGMSEEKEITTGRINYIIERNKENHDILRIQVRPYEYGVVLFKIKRPDYVEQGYVRTSGATVSLTEELRSQTRERKMRASYDGNMQKHILLRQACKERKQVLLKNYSSESGIKDRIVEPYMSLPEHDAFLCYDTSVSKDPIREFKIPRIGQVEILSKNWSNTLKHRNLSIDIFGMLQDQGKKPYKVKLKLAPRAYNLLKEEFNVPEKLITSNTDASDKEEFPWILATEVCKDEGIGRFYIGLANSIKIVEGKQLIKYVQDFVSANLTNAH